MAPFYNDDGTEVNPDLIPTPSLCLVCEKYEDPNEEIMCSLNRMDQQNDVEFICYAFKNIKS